MIQSQKWDQQQQQKKDQIIWNQTGWAGENKKLTDIENYPESPNENATWIST